MMVGSGITIDLATSPQPVALTVHANLRSSLVGYPFPASHPFPCASRVANFRRTCPACRRGICAHRSKRVGESTPLATTVLNTDALAAPDYDAARVAVIPQGAEVELTGEA